MIQAILYDLDGVLVDAMALHEEAFLAALRVEGKIDLTQQEHQAAYAGLPTKVKVQRLIAEGKLEARYAEAVVKTKQALTEEYIHQRIHPEPQRMTLLEHFRPHFSLGCVTNCLRKNAVQLLMQSNLLRFFEECLVTNEDAAPKPSPEPYRKACGILDVEPHKALVIEDHDVGLTSAWNAGCYSVKLPAYADLTIPFVWEAIKKAEAQDRMEKL